MDGDPPPGTAVPPQLSVNHSTASPPLPGVAESVEQPPAQIAAGLACGLVGAAMPDSTVTVAMQQAFCPSGCVTRSVTVCGPVSAQPNVTIGPKAPVLQSGVPLAMARVGVHPPPVVLPSSISDALTVTEPPLKVFETFLHRATGELVSLAAPLTSSEYA